MKLGFGLNIKQLFLFGIFAAGSFAAPPPAGPGFSLHNKTALTVKIKLENSNEVLEEVVPPSKFSNHEIDIRNVSRLEIRKADSNELLMAATFATGRTLYLNLAGELDRKTQKWKWKLYRQRGPKLGITGKTDLGYSLANNIADNQITEETLKIKDAERAKAAEEARPAWVKEGEAAKREAEKKAAAEKAERLERERKVAVEKWEAEQQAKRASERAEVERRKAARAERLEEERLAAEKVKAERAERLENNRLAEERAKARQALPEKERLELDRKDYFRDWKLPDPRSPDFCTQVKAEMTSYYIDKTYHEAVDIYKKQCISGLCPNCSNPQNRKPQAWCVELVKALGKCYGK